MRNLPVGLKESRVELVGGDVVLRGLEIALVPWGPREIIRRPIGRPLWPPRGTLAHP
jgi:hypothetical protein